MKKTLLIALWAIIPTLANANPQIPARTRLVTVGQWNQACQRFDSADTIALCKNKIHRAVAGGRSLGDFELINPERQDLLQSRSGVFFSREINELITALREDSGLRTQIELQENARCQAYAAAPDLIGTPQAGRRYGKLIESWLREYTDAGFSVQQVEHSQSNGMSLFRFSAQADDGRTITGQYAYDPQANAGIFSTCDHPAGTQQAKRNVDQFFRAILGSARRFA